MERRPAKKKLDDGNVIKGDWSGWGEYMQAKVQKLNAQFKEDIPKVPEDVYVPKIFDKVVIYINGYTVPPADELRRLLYLHGGRCQQYYTKRSVTHIIATNLPNSKISELRDELVVHPSWILDSIKARVLLPATQYLLYQPRKAAQKVLNFASNSKSPSTVTKPSLVGVPSVTTSPGLGLPLKDITSVHSSSIPPPTGEPSMDSLNEVSADFEDCETDRNVSDEDETGRNTDLASTSNNVPHEKAIANKDKDAEHIGGDLTLKAPNLTLQEITSVDGKTATKASGSAVFKKPGTSGLPRAGDANFVSEFYNNSRLHYLSTWGAEFKKYTSEIIKSSASNGWKGRGTGRVGPHGRVIMHIDMDSFFVSVTLRDQPHLRGKPIAVCHAGKGNSSDQASANNPYTSPKKSSSFFNSMSEIASCSYEARAAGVRNGMFLGPARKLCPDIHCVPYQFEEYRQVSQKLYDILVSYSHEIEAVSCDEAYIDVSEALEEGETPTKLAKKIRAEIEEATRCTASVGIGSNVLLARLCTRVAKPDGCYHLSREDDVNQFMASQKVDDLPGVGWSLGQKLQTLGAKTCADLQKFSCQALQKEFGPKTGLLLYQYCRGIDDRNLKTERERRSVSAEINYGIRFTKESEAIQFINELADEVQKRLKALDLKGRCITLKMKVRKAGAPTPRKFMGHGICDNIARSCTLPSVTDDSQVIAKQCHALFKQLNVAPEDIRGVGIQVSKLDEKNASSGAKNVRSLFDFMKPQANTDEGALKVVASEREDGISEEVRAPVEVRRPRNEQSKLPPLPRFSPQKTKQTRTCSSEKRLGDLGESLYLPSPSQIDPSVFEALPEDIRRSIEKSYAARNQRILLHRAERQEEEAFEPQQPQQQKTTKSKQSKTASRPTRTLFQASTSSEAAPSTSDLLPSPSQIDPEFLAALPDDVREELEQAYKLKDSNINGNRAQAEASSAPVLPVERGLGNDKGALQSGAIRKEETEKGNRPPSKQKQASLGEAITLPEVKQVIRQWTEAYEAPLEEDVEVLSDYLIRLVGTQNLEQLWRVFKFLDRTVDGREEWQMSCCAVLSQVQQVLSQKYHTKLSANSLKFTKLASVKNSLGRFSNNSRA